MKHKHNTFSHSLGINRQAARDIEDTFGEGLINSIADNIYKYHKEKDVMYSLDEEAQEVYDEIVEKYNAQFNLKWSGKH